VSVFLSREGLRSLRLAWATLLASATLAAAMTWATGAMHATEAMQLEHSRLLLSQAETRLERMQRDRDGLPDWLAVHRRLAQRGVLDGEDRLALAERLRRLQSSHRVASLEFDLEPQRELSLALGSAPSLALLASRLKITLRAMHEQHALSFFEAASATSRGALPPLSCSLRRSPHAPPGQATEATCTFEWLTVRPRDGQSRAP